tara:strand:+ start:6296 stop:6646 length:351 start_codon:yes stop_codon:yes gene_type:complete
MIVLEELEAELKTILQKDLQFVINDKVVREGILILFNMKDYYISFNIKTKKDIIKVYELPVPYATLFSEDKVIFDYTIDNVIKKDPRRRYLINSIYSNIGKKSKLFDNKLTIRFNA